MSRGTHRLIREGASLVESPEEVLADLGLAGGTSLADATIDPAALSETARSIVGALRGDTLGAEELAGRLSVPVTRILVELVELEMHGAIVRSAGGLYRLAAHVR
jgi:DNA processing protein